MKHITIKDIARHLSLSVSTVSRALINDKNIRQETKERVLETAKMLGYKPNPVATNLKYGHTNTVGVIVPEMLTPFASQVISGIQSVLYANGIKVIIAESDEDPNKERENLQTMERFMVDGIIICLCSYKENLDQYIRLQQAEMPMVFYDRIPYGMNVSQVIVDDYIKAFFLVEHLIREGYRHIVHLQGPDDVYNSVERARGYKDALVKFNIPFDKDRMLKAGLTFKDGANAADMLIEKGSRFIWYFHYMPVGNDAVPQLMPTPSQREMMYDRVRYCRRTKPLFAIDFQNDGEYVGGCVAGGRRYLHINANGDVDPCVFIHYSDSNIREKTLLECLQSPLFMAYHENQPFNENHLPCPMLENPQKLREMVAKTQAKSTDMQSPESAEHLCSKCDEYAKNWTPSAEKLWNESHKE